MERVLVIGSPGAGKTTLALARGEKLGLPVTHLDVLHWRDGWVEAPREEFDALLAEALARPRWIIDGNYSRTVEVRIRACDTAIFLDYPEALCMAGVAARVGQVRPDMPWTESDLDPELVALVRNYARDNRPFLLDLFQKYADKQVITFTDRTQADRWLSER